MVYNGKPYSSKIDDLGVLLFSETSIDKLVNITHWSIHFQGQDILLQL